MKDQASMTLMRAAVHFEPIGHPGGFGSPDPPQTSDLGDGLDTRLAHDLPVGGVAQRDYAAAGCRRRQHNEQHAASRPTLGPASETHVARAGGSGRGGTAALQFIELRPRLHGSLAPSLVRSGARVSFRRRCHNHAPPRRRLAQQELDLRIQAAKIISPTLQGFVQRGVERTRKALRSAMTILPAY